MARISLDRVSFHYPIFDLGARSLKVSLFSQMSGGSVGSNAGVVQVQALEDISFDLEDGDRLALVGRNGAGKSTMLRLLAGLAHPQRGRIVRTGRVVPLIEKGLGINGELSGLANIELPLRLLGASSKEVKRAKEDIPEFTGLGPFINLPVRTYSEGMKARLSFAICTAIEADVLILDEWLGAGDIDFQEKAQARIKDMVDRTRIVILATHSLELAVTACNLAAWLDRGKMVMFGDSRAIVDTYVRTMHNPVRAIATG